MANILKKMFGTKNDREVKRIQSVVAKINQLEPNIKKLTDEQLTGKTSEFKDRIQNGETLNQILPEAFAVCREAAWRVLEMRHFDVQLVGGVVLHEGRIAEMKTGEGKTLTATLPLYLNALTGRGCHLVTVNDYLAKRDSEWMGRLYGFLGLTTGLIVHGLNDRQRKEAYSADITYGTNNEFGFDYLRDNMKTELDQLVQPDHYFSIVDEVDSILIDEARTPLIISGPTETNTDIYYKVNTAVPGLHKDSDYILDEKSNTVTLTEDGISRVEKRLHVDNLYDPKNIDYLHHVQQALKAHTLFKKDVDYVVRDNQLIIVDEHTGRLMPGRRYSDGLHGALEAKEHLKVENENQTLATITFQNYFRMYDKLAGMTGTADTEAVEFNKIYKLDVVVIPTNKPLARIDNNDIIYRTAREKFNVIADEIAKRQKKGQPVLVGTVSVERSELLSSLLKKRGIPHEILNAKNHSREATIITNAGKKGNVTISTNMAGRGTDIVLGEGVKEAGGLCVIGTERHESRRIDNQLRGRSGRQGDPGESLFYLSLEDDLMRIFASDKLSAIMGRLGMEEEEAIVSPMVTRAIERAQKRVEEQNFSSRKHLLEYDDVMNQQRQVVYSRRRELLKGETNIDFFEDVTRDISLSVVDRHAPESSDKSSWDFDQVTSDAQSEFNNQEIALQDLNSPELSSAGVAEHITEQALESYKKKTEMVGSDQMKLVENFIYMQIIDQAWKDHLLAMDHLKDSVSLRGYAQRDPLQEYKKEAYRLFASMMGRIEEETTLALLRMPPPESAPEQRHQVFDESNMNFAHPQASKSYREGPSDDEIVRQSSRGNHQVDQTPFKRDQAKVGRNDPCPCGSGKKYKKCHGSPTANDPSPAP